MALFFANFCRVVFGLKRATLGRRFYISPRRISYMALSPWSANGNRRSAALLKDIAHQEARALNRRLLRLYELNVIFGAR
jgi:hypothetical protein